MIMSSIAVRQRGTHATPTIFRSAVVTSRARPRRFIRRLPNRLVFTQAMISSTLVGNGTMLRIAERAGARSAIGLLATEEEVAVVRRLGLNVRQGLADKLPLADASATAIVCNSVLLVVPREKIPNSLREIYRVAKPGARIFLGEIPRTQELDPTPTFATSQELLSYLYRKHGLGTWFGMVRRLAYQKFKGERRAVNSGTKISFWAAPEEFISAIQAADLRLVRHWECWQYPSRSNYLVQKPE